MVKFTEPSVQYVVQINNEDFETSSPSLTGQQIKVMAGLPDDWLVMQPGPQQDRQINDEMSVNLTPEGVEHFYVLPPDGLTDRVHYRIQIDQTTYDSSRPQLTGMQIRELASLPAEPRRSLVLERNGKPDKTILDDTVVDLTPRGTEHLFTVPDMTYGANE